MISKTFKKRLVLTTAIAASMFSYGRRAYANCYQSSGATYLCGGAETAEQDINHANASVSTLAGFSVNANANRGIHITGDGALSFIDTHKSSVTATGAFGIGLFAETHDDGMTPGSVTINVNGAFSGTRDGIRGYVGDDATGGVSITLSGSATGTDNDGIAAVGYINSADVVSVTTEKGSSVSGGNIGIYATNFGYTDSIGVAIKVSGTVTGGNDGINAFVKYTGDLKIDTYAGATVNGDDADGIRASNRGTNGGLTIHTRDIVTGGGAGIYGYARNGVVITTDADVSGGSDGINAYSSAGTVNVTASTNVTGSSGDGIHAKVGSDGTDLTVTTGKNHTVSGHSFGIYALNEGTGDTTITANGDVILSGFGNSVYAHNTSQGGKMTITTYGALYAGGGNGVYALNEGDGDVTVDVEGNSEGSIQVRNKGTGDLLIMANGDITSYYQGILALNDNGSSGDLTIMTGQDSKIDGHNYTGIYALNHGTGAINVDIEGSVSNTNHAAIYARDFGAGSGNMTFTFGQHSSLKGNSAGLYAVNDGDGDVSITADGYINGYQAIQVANNGTGDITITVDGHLVGGSGVLANNNAAGGDMTIAIGADANIEASYAGVYANNTAASTLTVTNEGKISGTGFIIHNESGLGTFTNKKGADIEGPTGLDIRSGGLDQGIINEAGATIHGSGDAIVFDAVESDTPLIIEGGHIIGAVRDTAPEDGHSLVKIAGDFTSEGTFDVSSLTVEVNKKFTLANDITTYLGVVDNGTITVTTAGSAIVDGGLTVNKSAMLDVQKNFSVDGGTTNAGTIKIASDAALTLDTMKASTGTIDFGVSSMANYGSLDVTGGGISLAGATPVTVTMTGGNLTTGKAIMIASGDSTITGVGNPGGTLTTVLNSALWKLQIADGTNTSDGVTDINGANDLWLHITKNASLSSLASTPGNANVGNALQTIIGGSPALQTVQAAINAAPDAATINGILERLQPTVDGHIVTAALDNGVRVQGLADNRMIAWRGGDDAGTGVAAGSASNGATAWVQGYGQRAYQGMRDGIAGYRSDLWGSAMGADTDRLLKDSLVGLSFNYARLNANAENTNQTGTDIDSYGVNFYASRDLGQGIFLNGQLGYAYNDINGVRYNVLAPGDAATASYGSNQFSAKALLGHDYTTTHDLIVTPNMSATYTKLLVDGYTEQGSGGGLNVRRQDYDTLDLGIGVDTYMQVKYADGNVLKPALHAGYRYAAISDRIDTSASFIGDPANTVFTSVGAHPARSTFDGGASLTYSMTGNWDLSANYNYAYKEDYHAHSGLARATVHF